MSHLVARAISSVDKQPPQYRDREDDHPTLLISWWCTGFALFLILLRLWGRFIRTERFFREDKIMALSIAPLLIRMAFVDPIMLFGTNNTQTASLTDSDIYSRSIGSRLVLASRIFYALFIWIAKFTVSEYLKRLTENIWTKRYELVLQCIRVFLALTFVAVVISTLAECQPITHYWQVVPDPGPQCRSGFAQLITMGACDIITDILLVAFPIPIVWHSKMPMRRKLSLCSLFSLSIALIAITGYRVPAIIAAHSDQQTRTLWASIEILAATAVSNALILGSFVRDRGVKKTKFRHASRNNSIVTEPAINRTMTKRHWGTDSDEDLFATVQGRLGSIDHSAVSKPKAAVPARCGNVYRESVSEFSSSSMDTKAGKSSSGSGSTTEELELYDIGGVLEEGTPLRQPSSPDSVRDLVRHAAPQPSAGLNDTPFGFADAGGLLSGSSPSPTKRSKPVEPKFPPSPPTSNTSSKNTQRKSEKSDNVRETIVDVPPDSQGIASFSRPKLGKSRKTNIYQALRMDKDDNESSNRISSMMNSSKKQKHPPHPSSFSPQTPNHPTHELQDPGGLLASPPTSPKSSPPPRKPSGLLLQDPGGLIAPPPPTTSRFKFAPRPSHSSQSPQQPPSYARHDPVVLGANVTASPPALPDSVPTASSSIATSNNNNNTTTTTTTSSSRSSSKSRPKIERSHSTAEETRFAKSLLGKIKDARNQPAEPMSPAGRLRSVESDYVGVWGEGKGRNPAAATAATAAAADGKMKGSGLRQSIGVDQQHQEQRPDSTEPREDKEQGHERGGMKDIGGLLE